MPITDKQYGFIISLCEWNNPNAILLGVEAQRPGRLNLRPTLVQLKANAIQAGDASLQDITDFMTDYLTSVRNDEEVWFAEIELEVRLEYG